MKRFLLVALTFLGMVVSQSTQAQSYCEYNVGFAWCGTGWEIDDITIGSFSEQNSGCNNNAPYSKNLSSQVTVTKGAGTPFTLASGGLPVQWAIWVDCNADGDFTDASDYFWATGSASSTASGTMIIPTSATAAQSRIRIASRNQTAAIVQSDACNFGFQAETQDFTIVMNAPGGCGIPTTLTAIPSETSAFLSWDSVGTLYNVEYGLKGFTPSNGTTLNVSTDTLTITSLTADTEYDFYVQNDCSAATGDSSYWNGPVSFRTLCSKISSMPYIETFDDSTSWIPNTNYNYTADVFSSCWDRNPTFSYNYAWLVRTGSTSTSNTGPTNAFGGTGNYLYLESFGLPGDTADLTSPLLDITSLTTPYITFRYHMYGANMGDLYVEVSSNSGVTWTKVDSLLGEQQTSSSAAWLERGIDVSTYKSANFMVRFRSRKAMQSGIYADLAIDHLQIDEAPSCPKASGLTISNITGSGADMNWTSNETKFYIEIGPQGFTQGTGAIDTLTTTSHTLSNLPGDTYWDVYIQTDCQANNNGISAWAGPYSFRTLIAPTWLEDFDVNGFVPNIRWYRAQGLIGNPTTLTGTYSSWGEDGWLNNGYVGSVRCYISNYSGSADEWFFTESIDLGTGNNWELHFDAASTISGQSGSAPLEADDTLKVVISTDNGQTWNNTNTIFNLTQAYNLSNARQTFVANLTGYSGVVKVGFYMESTVANTVGTDIFLDNIGIRPQSSCPAAWGVHATNVGGNDATINWSSYVSSGTFLLEFGPAGYAQGTGTKTGTTTSTSMVVSNLQPLTAYDFYVLTVCGTDTTVAGPAYVLTGCPAIFGTPYSETFELLAAGSPPVGGNWDNCWTTTPYSTSQFRWQTKDGHSNWSNTGPSGDHTTGAGIYMYTEASSNGFDANAIFGPVDLSQATTPTLSFWYHMYGVDMGELHVDISTDQVTWVDAFAIVGQQQNSLTDAWKQAHMALSQFANDTVYFRFRGLRGSGYAGDMAIDDITINDGPATCVSPTGLFANNLTTTTADLYWGSYEAPFTIEWGPIGFTPATGQGTVVNNISASTYSLTGLSAGLGYDFYVKDTCTNTLVGPHTFFTSCTGSLSGNYTVGGPTGPTNFNSLNEAILTLQNCGMSGSVTLNLAGIVDTGSYTIGSISGISSSNTLTINGTGSDSIFATPTNDFVFEFDGASYVTLKNMHIINKFGVMAIWLHNGSNNINIEGCTLYGDAAPIPNSSSSVIAASSVSTSSSLIGDNCYNVSILNNTLIGAYSSISIYGDNQVPTHGLVVQGNEIIGARYYSVRAYGVDSVSVLSNSVLNMNNTTGGYGIYLSRVNEIDIQENNLQAPGTGIYLTNVNTGSVSSNSNVINNMGAANSTYGRGFYTYNSGYLNVYHNSFHTGHNAFYASGSNSKEMDVRNNIFYSTGNRAVYTSSSVDTTIVFDHNVYDADYSSLAYINGNGYTDLSAWQSGQASQNVNSIQGNPGFYSSTDLHVIGSLPNDGGDNAVNVVTDIDGDTRPASGATYVDIGADEYTPKNTDVFVSAVSLPYSGCGDSLTPVVVEIKNLGIDTLTTTSITVNVTGDIVSTLNATYNGNLAQFEIDYVQVGTINTYAGASAVDFEAYSTLAADEDNTNDTVYAGPLFFISTNPTAIAPDTTCYDMNDSATFAGVPTPGTAYAWYANATDTTPVAVADSFTFPMSGQTGWYLGYQSGQKDSIQPGTYGSSYGGDHGLMFDITAKTNLEINGFGIHSDVALGFTGDLIIHIIPFDTYAGHEESPADWTFVDTVSFTSAGTNVGTIVTLPNPIQMPIGARFAIYLDFDAIWSYTPNQLPINSTLMTYEGAVGFYTAFSSPSSDRVFEGEIFATSVSCSNAKTLVELPIYSDTAVADFTSIVSQPNKVDVDAAASQGDLVDWNFGDGNTATGISASHTYVNGGTYTITCTVTDTVCGTIDTATESVMMTIGIEENALTSSLSVFPNPSEGVFNVSFKLDVLKDVNLEVIDQLGRVLYNHDFNTTMSVRNHKIDLSDQANGLYFIRINAEEMTAVKKITKM